MSVAARVLGIGVLVALAGWGCTPPGSTVDRNKVSLVVGAGGGTLSHPAGAKLIVPPGALSAEVELSIEGVDAPAIEGAPALGQGFKLGPDGQTFLAAVQLVVPWSEAKLPSGTASADLRVMIAPDGASAFSELPTSADGATLLASTTHFSTVVAAAPQNPIFISPGTLPNPEEGVPYSLTFSATGGTAPYSWSVKYGQVPTGLTLSAAGVLSGTPTAAGNFWFVLLLTDSTGRTLEAPLSIDVQNAPAPVPTFTAISPDNVDQGSGPLTVTVTGTNFVARTKVHFAGVPMGTTFVSGTQLTAIFPSNYFSIPGTHAITVVTSVPGGGTAGPLTFTVNAVAQNPLPTLTSAAPNQITAGAGDTQLTLTGTNFVAASQAMIGSTALATTFDSATQLRAVVPASLLTAITTLGLFVRNPAPGGGNSSSVSVAVVGPPNPVPTLTMLSRDAVPAGFTATPIVLTGTNLVSGGHVLFGGTQLAAQVQSATTATFTIPQARLTTAGTFSVSFVNPTPGGGASNTAPFTVLTPAVTHLATNLIYPHALALDSTDVYFSSTDGGVNTTQVRRVPKSGGASTLLAASQRGVTNLHVDGSNVYWYYLNDINNAQGYVRQVPTSGGSVITLATDANGLRGATFDATDAYWVGANGDLRRVPLGTSASTVIGSLYGNPGTELYMVNDASRLYFGQSQFSSAGLWSAPKTGGSPAAYQQLAGTNVDIDANDLYFIALGGAAPSSVQKIPKVGGTATVLSPALSNTRDIAVDSSGVYVSDSAGIHLVPLAGGPMKTLLATYSQTIALDATSVYFADYNGGTISRLAKPGVAAITGLSPGSAPMGSGDVTLTVSLVAGTLVAGAVVHANGTALSTNAGATADQLVATLPASYLTAPGTVQITVVNPGQPASPPSLFTVENPAPTLTLLTPDNVDQGSGNTLLTVTGTNFVTGGLIRFGSNALQTTVASATSASATIVSSRLTASGTVQVTFENPAPGGGASNALPFTINAVATNPAPQVTGQASPASVRTGTNGLIVTIQLQPGSAISSTEVRIAGQLQPTDTSSYATGLVRASISYSLASDAFLDLAVVNPGPGGGQAYAGSLTVGTTGNALPAVTSIAPTNVNAGSIDLPMTLSGSNFVSGGRVRIRAFPNDVVLTPTSVTPTQVMVTIPEAYLPAATTFPVVYENPTPGAGVSNATTFTVN